jgi:hypothetical protein
MSVQFEKQVTVKAHANYGAFRATDNSFYKPTGSLKLEQFIPGETYNVKGYASDSGKTNYITMLLTGEPVQQSSIPASPNTFPAAKRRLALPKEEQMPNPGDDKILGGKRDFMKEAKGKTASLFIAALLGKGVEPKVAVEEAEKTVALMEEKGYF